MLVFTDNRFRSLLMGCFISIITACNTPSNQEVTPLDSNLTGGRATVFSISSKAFDQPAPNLSQENFDAFQAGNSFFRSSWVSSPASTTARDGLGPILNSISCTGCHINDGRGAPPITGEKMSSMLIRLSIPGQNSNGGPLAEPTYGGQLQNRSISGFVAEGKTTISYENISGTYSDGTSYTLQKPTYTLSELGYGPIAENVLLSPRTAPKVAGLGLLAAISDRVILDLVDENDFNGDGISGKANYVWDVEKKTLSLGRFGWKANQPSLRQQNAGAFNGDMGLTSSLFPALDCTSSQQDCLDAPHGGTPEITEHMLTVVTKYISGLGIPARRDVDNELVKKGKALFITANCSGCHIPSITTSTLEGFPEFTGMEIQPFTDLLLHDLGEGLSDQRPDFLATGSEWRTTPLWGIGLIETVNGHTNYLHDGRARNIEEAILWHGGEAQKATDYFKALPIEDRNAIISFLKSI